MESGTETVEIDVYHSSRRQISADGEEIRIRIKCEKDDIVSNELLNNSSDEKEGKLCYYYEKFGKCKFEDKCHFLHHDKQEITRTIINDNTYQKSSINPKRVKSKEIKSANGDIRKQAPHKEHSDTPNRENTYLNIDSSNTRQCKFFRSKKGCRLGDECPFNHYRSVGDAGSDDFQDVSNKMKVLYVDDLPVSQPQNDKRDYYKESEKGPKGRQPSERCRFFLKDGFCKKGDHCDFIHLPKQEEKKKVKSPVIDDGFEGPNMFHESKAISSVDPNKMKKKRCIYYKRNGCRLREDCPYLHDRSDGMPTNKGDMKSQNVSDNQGYEDKENNRVQVIQTDENLCNVGKENIPKNNELESDNSNDNSKRSNQYCTFFLTPKGCFRGKNCLFLHPGGENETDQSKNYLSLQQVEFQQLEKRFSAGDKYKLVQSEPSKIYSVVFEPSDPDWGIVVKDFALRVEFPIEYPKKLFDIKLEDNEIYPEGFTGFMNDGIKSWIEEREQARDENDLAFRPFLKWFDRNVETLVLVAGRKIILGMHSEGEGNLVKQLRDAEEAGISLIPHEDILQNSAESKWEPAEDDAYDEELPCDRDTDNIDPISEENCCDTDMFNSEVLVNVDGMERNEAETNSNNGAKLSSKVKYGTEIKFSHFYVNENVASLVLQSLLLVAQCIRCKGKTEFKLVSKKKAGSSCKKCHVSQTATFYPEIVHQYSHIAGYLHLEGCKAFDAVLLDSTVIVNCLNCSKDTIKKGIAYGKKGDSWCQSCHTKMEIQIMCSKFTQLQKNGEKLQEVKVVGAKKAVKHPGIKEGTPLPDNGSCKHYKKSYRWLRFPCCGKVYPCDVCHEESVENEHEMKFATRMICGHCSKEQPFAKDKPCIGCKQNVTKSRSAHWEGGKGCRNRTTMDRNDNKKTTGLGKTISRKKATES